MARPERVLAPDIRAHVRALQAMQHARDAQASGERVARLAQEGADVSTQELRALLQLRPM
jgi:hypothetical protein